jgi:hypothetical protein
LDDPDVDTVFQQVRGKGMAEGVAADPFADTGPGDGHSHSLLKAGFQDMMAAGQTGAGINAEVFPGEEILPAELLARLGIFFPEGVGEVVSKGSGLTNRSSDLSLSHAP